MAYLWQREQWPYLTVDGDSLKDSLSMAYNNIGILEGQMRVLGFNSRNLTSVQGFASEIQKSFEIEGVQLSDYSLRSSVARKLKLEDVFLLNGEKLDKKRPHIDSIVEILSDAVYNCHSPLTKNRLLDWHSKMFGGQGEKGFNGLYSIRKGTFRTDENGPMRVISGYGKNETVHFEAPPAEILSSEMDYFLKWFNLETTFGGCIVKSAAAHLHFIEIHPFEDGNGRMARTIADMALFRGLKTTDHLFSMSRQLCKERKDYYSMLHNVEKSNSTDITEWVNWYTLCLNRSVLSVIKEIDEAQKRKEFWEKTLSFNLNERQNKIIGMLLENFEGNLNSSKYAKICKCSQDSAVRDLNQLIKLNILKKSESAGRSTSYIFTQQL